MEVSHTWPMFPSLPQECESGEASKRAVTTSYHQHLFVLSPLRLSLPDLLALFSFSHAQCWACQRPVQVLLSPLMAQNGQKRLLTFGQVGLWRGKGYRVGGREDVP